MEIFAVFFCGGAKWEHKSGVRRGNWKRGANCFKSGNVANQKELYRKGGGRIQRTVNQGMSGTQGVAGAQKMEWELKGAA